MAKETMKTSTKIWICIGLLVLIASALAYVLIVKGVLAGYGPADPPEGALALIRLPEGFSIEYYARNVTGPRSLAVANDNTVFVSTTGNAVYAVQDKDGDNEAETHYQLVSGLDSANGIAFDGTDLFIVTTSKVLKIENVLSKLGLPNRATTVFEPLPHDGGHDWRYSRLGPDGKLYIGIGSTCNVCEREDPFATLARMNTDGTNFEVYARGVRNTVGFDWDENGQLWFTDNGRDWLGDEAPGDELNTAPQPDMHFGFPYCQQGDIKDPDFGDLHPCSDFTPPARVLGPHVASLGMRFSKSDEFPEQYRNGIFIAEHGSWNRADPLGYRVTFVPLKDGKPDGYEVFAEGWLQGGSAWGRPVDVDFLPDGSLLVSDDKGNAVYRITYHD